MDVVMPARTQEWDGCHVRVDDWGDHLSVCVWTSAGVLVTSVEAPSVGISRRHGFGAGRPALLALELARAGSWGLRHPGMGICDCDELVRECVCAEQEERCLRGEALDGLTAELDAEARSER